MTHAAATVDQMLPPYPAERGLDVYNKKLGMWVFLASEVMFFAALIGTYVILRFGATGEWAKPGIVLNIKITAFNTFLLICSSVSMVKAYAAIQDGDPKKMRFWLLMTILDAHERGTAQDGHQQPEAHLLRVAVLDRRVRFDHRHARADQQERVEGSDLDVEHDARLGPLARGPEPEDDVGPDQGRKEHDLRSEEHPHPELLVVDVEPPLGRIRGQHLIDGGGCVRHRSSPRSVARDRRAGRLTVGGQLGVLRQVVLGRLRRAELIGAAVHRGHLLPVAVRRGARQ